MENEYIAYASFHFIDSVKVAGDPFSLIDGHLIDHLGAWREAEAPAITQMLWNHISRGSKCLDLGCGIGVSTHLLTLLGAKENNIWGIDINEANLAEAKVQVPKAHYLWGDISQTLNLLRGEPPREQLELKRGMFRKYLNPKPPRRFDLILANMVTNHLNNIQYNQLLHQLPHIMSPHSCGLFIIPHPFRPLYLNQPHQYNLNQPFVDRSPWSETILYHHRTIAHQIRSFKQNHIHRIKLVSVWPDGELTPDYTTDESILAALHIHNDNIIMPKRLAIFFQSDSPTLSRFQ